IKEGRLKPYRPRSTVNHLDDVTPSCDACGVSYGASCLRRPSCSHRYWKKLRQRRHQRSSKRLAWPSPQASLYLHSAQRSNRLPEPLTTKLIILVSSFQDPPF